MSAEQSVLHTLRRENKKDTSPALVLGMVPLSMAKPGTEISIHSIKGKDETRHFLERLGFVDGAVVTVITELGGNIIVNVKGTRVAISKAMANRIYGG